jgi:hypothetical protein
MRRFPPRLPLRTARWPRVVALAWTLGAALVSGACFSSETVIHVRPDGSGTIEVTNLANKDALGMAAGLARGAAQQAGTDPARAPNLDNLGDLFDEAKIREMASGWGEGVRFVSSEPLTRDGMTGVRATFAFPDVRLLQTTAGGNTGAPAPRLRFDITPGADGATVLTVRLPQGTAPAADGAAPAAVAPGAPKEIPPEALAMVRGMFKGARIDVAVEVEGAIVTTDAPVRDGSRVTIFGLDFDRLLSDPAKFSALQGLKPGTDFVTARQALEGVPGVILPATPSVTIAFK